MVLTDNIKQVCYLSLKMSGLNRWKPAKQFSSTNYQRFLKRWLSVAVGVICCLV